MGKQRWRRLCCAALAEAGYSDPQLYFENNRHQYFSYWGSGLRRAEVVLDKGTGAVQIFELHFAT